MTCSRSRPCIVFQSSSSHAETWPYRSQVFSVTEREKLGSVEVQISEHLCVWKHAVPESRRAGFILGFTLGTIISEKRTNKQTGEGGARLMAHFRRRDLQATPCGRSQLSKKTPFNSKHHHCVVPKPHLVTVSGGPAGGAYYSFSRVETRNA